MAKLICDEFKALNREEIQKKVKNICKNITPSNIQEAKNNVFSRIEEISRDDWERQYRCYKVVMNCEEARNLLHNNLLKFKCWSMIDRKYIVSGVTEETAFIYLTKMSNNPNLIVNV